MIYLGYALETATQNLTVLPQANPRLEAELLLSVVLQRPRSYLMTWPEQLLTAAETAMLQTLIQRRQRGEPIAYILGQRSFWTMDLLVNPSVLIPRPETELLVELALAEKIYPTPPAPLPLTGEEGVKILPSMQVNNNFTVVDLGTGSGAIAAAIALERPDWTVYATDISDTALTVAASNFKRLGVAIQTYSGDWYAALPRDLQVDLIVSNPPYIAATDQHLQQGDLPWEPQHALVSGADGLDALYVLCVEARSYLRPGGAIFLEHGYNQGAAVRVLLNQAGFTAVRTWRDLAGHERVTGGKQINQDNQSSKTCP